VLFTPQPIIAQLLPMKFGPSQEPARGPGAAAFRR
jgi:hypothetical protein